MVFFTIPQELKKNVSNRCLIFYREFSSNSVLLLPDDKDRKRQRSENTSEIDAIEEQHPSKKVSEYEDKGYTEDSLYDKSKE
jgi:hypothetical protein